MNRTILLLLALLLTTGTASAALTDNIKSYYTFDDAQTSGTTLTDVAGTNDATLVNTPTTGVTGIINESYTFTATSSEYLSGVATLADTTSFSVSTWVKTTDFTNNHIWSQHPPTGAGATDPLIRFLYDSSTNVVFQIFGNGRSGSGSGVTINAAHGVSSGAWAHLVATYDQSTGNMSVYVNGNLVGSATYGGGSWSDATDFNIARSYLGSAFYFDGSIDEFGIWNRSLTQAEVSDLYNSGSGEQYPFGTAPPSSSNVTLTAIDAYNSSSITTFNATINGTTYTTSNGTIVLPILDNTTSLYNITFTAADYWSNTSLNVNVSSGSYEGSLAQNFVQYICRERYTGASVTCDNTIQVAPAGNVTANWSASGYFNEIYSYNLPAKSTTTINCPTAICVDPANYSRVYLTDFYNFLLNVSVNDYAGNTEENFLISLNNSNLSINISSDSNTTGDCGCNATAVFYLLSGYVYEVEVNATSTIYDDPVNQNGFANITNTTGSLPETLEYQFNLSAARAVNLSYFWEDNLTTFAQNVTAFFIPTDEFNNLFFTTTSTSGNDTLFNLPVGTYIVEMLVDATDTSGPPGLGGDSGGYHDEERFIRLTPLTGSTITGYFRENTTGEHKTFNVVNSQSSPQSGWYVRAQRYYNATGWITVDEGRSNIDGQADINVLSDEYYRLLLLDEDFNVVYTSERTLLPESQYEISPTASSVLDPRINATTGVGAIITVETAANGSKYFQTVLSTSGSSDTFNVKLYKRHSDGLTLVSSQTTTSSGATVISWIPNETGRYVLEAYKIGSQYVLGSQGYAVNLGSEVFGTQGVLFSIFLLIAIIGTGVFSAAAAIVLSVLALVVSSSIGLFSVQLTAIVGVAIVGGMILLRRSV